MRYTAHVLHGFNPLEALEDEWRGLFNQAETPNPFFSAEWVFTWLNHRGGRGFPVMLIVRDDDERLVTAWPFFEYPAIGGRGLWVGLSDIADCLEPLVLRPDDVLLRTVFEALGQLLGEYRFIWIPLLTKTWFASISSRRCKRSPIWRASTDARRTASSISRLKPVSTATSRTPSTARRTGTVAEGCANSSSLAKSSTSPTARRTNCCGSMSRCVRSRK